VLHPCCIPAAAGGKPLLAAASETFENKRPDEKIPTGQLITLRALARLPHWTVAAVHGNPPAGIVSWGDLEGPQVPTSREAVRGTVQRWWNTRPHPNGDARW
jgi:hypothetical protein